MIGDYRFFQDFFDGQIVSEESDKYKMFKVMLYSIASIIGLFLVFAGFCNIAEFLLLQLGMIWNLYTKLDKQLGVALGVFVALLYVFFASNFAVYSNAFIYIACYIPLQLIATTKDYEDGDFIQIRKHVSDYNKILFLIFFMIVFVALACLGYNLGSRFLLFDSFTATLLVCSALLRNERYCEYYVMRIFALCTSIILWILLAVEYGTIGTLAIILMYLVYLIHDIVTYIMQNQTYINEYMIQVEKYQKIEEQLLIQEKVKFYAEIRKEEK